MKGLFVAPRRLLAIFVCVALLVPMGFVKADGVIVILSKLSTSPPSIDGLFQSGEWSGPQIVISSPIQTFVYFANDWQNLYILVDATGDVTDDANDECLLVFNGNSTNVILDIWGTGGTVWSDGFHAVIGYAGSPNSATSHKIYEWSIPLTTIGAKPCQPIYFCSPPQKHEFLPVSMPFDWSTGRDNVWPPNLNYSDLSTWAVINLNCGVGGEILSPSSLSLIVPYALMAVSTLLGLFVIRRKGIHY